MKVTEKHISNFQIHCIFSYSYHVIVGIQITDAIQFGHKQDEKLEHSMCLCSGYINISQHKWCINERLIPSTLPWNENKWAGSLCPMNDTPKTSGPTQQNLFYGDVITFTCDVTVVPVVMPTIHITDFSYLHNSHVYWSRIPIVHFYQVKQFRIQSSDILRSA